MVMPGIILAFGLLVLALAVDVQLSLWTIGVAHVVMTMPFLTLVVMSRLEGLGKSLEESAMDLGENAWMTFWRITFPLILPGIGACLILSFISSFDEFLYALFLGGNQVTLPVFMWTQVRFPQTLPTILALGSCIFLGSATLILIAEWLRRMGVKETRMTRRGGRRKGGRSGNTRKNCIHSQTDILGIAWQSRRTHRTARPGRSALHSRWGHAGARRNRYRVSQQGSETHPR